MEEEVPPLLGAGESERQWGGGRWSESLQLREGKGWGAAEAWERLIGGFAPREPALTPSHGPPWLRWFPGNSWD